MMYRGARSGSSRTGASPGMGTSPGRGGCCWRNHPVGGCQRPRRLITSFSTARTSSVEVPRSPAGWYSPLMRHRDGTFYCCHGRCLCSFIFVPLKIGISGLFL